MKTLETERLTLRGFEETDDVDMFAYASNPNIGPSAGWPPHMNIEESRKILRMFIQADDNWALVDKAGGHVIGSLGYRRDAKRTNDHAYEIGYVLSQDYWGQGLVAEAVRAVLRYLFMDLHADVVSAVHYPFNTQSRRVMEKCGMKYEGTLRKSARLFTGEVHDAVCHAITKDEYLGLDA